MRLEETNQPGSWDCQVLTGNFVRYLRDVNNGWSEMEVDGGKLSVN